MLNLDQTHLCTLSGCVTTKRKIDKAECIHPEHSDTTKLIAAIVFSIFEIVESI